MGTSDHWHNKLKTLSKSAREQQEIERAAAAKRRQQAAEAAHFATEVGTVTPLKTTNRRATETDRSPIKVRRHQTERDQAQDTFIGTDSEDIAPTQFAAGGGGKNDIRKLLSSRDEIVATLDLHGYKQEEAQVVLNEFIDYVQQRGVVGEIIHGSGLGSRGFVSTLKNLVRRWLIAHPAVLAYTEPPGNDGSVWILLKRRRRTNTE